MKNWFKSLKIKRRLIATLVAWHFYGHPSTKLKVVGVTGTNGKTTTATLLYRIATQLGYKTGLIGTVEIIVGEEKRKAEMTTPDPIILNKLLSEMVAQKCEYVFMEVSSHALDQKRVAGIDFVGGIFTNLTHDHLDYHKNFENYFQAKKKFFKMLPAKAFALSNLDDSYGSAMLENIKALKFSYSLAKQTDFSGEILKMDSAGLQLNVRNGQSSVLAITKLLGKFNAYNLLGVWSASYLLGFDMEKVGKILEEIKPPRGRFEHFTSKAGVLVVVDYAHTPDALEKILLAVREIKKPGGRIISIFGCGGNRDPLKRPKMGEIGVALSDITIITSDNPRHEDPEKIIEEIKLGCQGVSTSSLKSRLNLDFNNQDNQGLTLMSHSSIKFITDRRAAILEASRLAQKDDIILCAGKGHEDYQDIKGVKYHFDDMEELKKCFL
jgi:UDP-N-acetylmuramoyl-L-alanyl-D-glutamate--2,6-diaminopimelate ligase